MGRLNGNQIICWTCLELSFLMPLTLLLSTDTLPFWCWIVVHIVEGCHFGILYKPPFIDIVVQCPLHCIVPTFWAFSLCRFNFAITVTAARYHCYCHHGFCGMPTLSLVDLTLLSLLNIAVTFTMGVNAWMFMYMFKNWCSIYVSWICVFVIFYVSSICAFLYLHICVSASCSCPPNGARMLATRCLITKNPLQRSFIANKRSRLFHKVSVIT